MKIPSPKLIKIPSDISAMTAPFNSNKTSDFSITCSDNINTKTNTTGKDLKTMEVHTNKIKRVGSLWISMWLYKYVIFLNIRCWKFLIQRKVTIATTLYQIIIVIIMISFNFHLLFYYTHFNHPLIYVVICFIYILIMFIMGAIFILKLKRILSYREQLRILDLLYIINLRLAYILSMYITLILGLKDIYDGFGLIILLFNIGIMENLNMIAFILFYPIIGLMLILSTTEKISYLWLDHIMKKS